MKWFSIISCAGLGALLVGALAGCGTPDVNPASPHPQTGYVDFYTSSCQDLSWRVKRLSEKDGAFHDVFSEYTPITGNILRLATPPGTNQFELWVNNQVTTGPLRVTV